MQLSAWTMSVPQSSWGQQTEPMDSTMKEKNLEGVVVKAARGTRSLTRVESVDIIGQNQLIRAACCNLGESFTANPSHLLGYDNRGLVAFRPRA